MPEIVIEQAICHRPDHGVPALLARSPGFRDDWQAEAERLIAGFGERPAGVPCASAVFAQPFHKAHVAVVHVADEKTADSALPRALWFHMLVLPRQAYLQLIGDPFSVAERFPPPMHSSGELPALSTPAEPLPKRTVAQVQEVLKRVKQAALQEDIDPAIQADKEEADIHAAEGPALLGGAQVLVDGGKLVFVRPEPDTGLLRGLWTLLPTTTRNQLWPASFAFGNQLGFDALIVPQINGHSYVGYINEEQAADYPTGRYELSLQTAAEAGDQDELDALFGRRSLRETWRLGLTLLAILFAAVVAMKFVLPLPEGPRPEPRPPSENLLTVEQARQFAGIAASSVSVGDPWLTLALVRVAGPVERFLTMEQRNQLSGVAASSVSVGDPWVALALIQVGTDLREQMRQSR